MRKGIDRAIGPDAHNAAQGRARCNIAAVAEVKNIGKDIRIRCNEATRAEMGAGFFLQDFTDDLLLAFYVLVAGKPGHHTSGLPIVLSFRKVMHGDFPWALIGFARDLIEYSGRFSGPGDRGQRRDLPHETIMKQLSGPNSPILRRRK
jgi:hypothetical protein